MLFNAEEYLNDLSYRKQYMYMYYATGWYTEEYAHYGFEFLLQGSILALANLLNAGWFPQKASCNFHHLLILASWKDSL